MGRYLKSVSMKAFDGSAIKIPFCCIYCKKDQCKFPCPEYADEMNGQKCSRFEMEFGEMVGWPEFWLSVLRNVIYLAIIAILVWILNVVVDNLKDECVVVVDRSCFAGATGVECRIEYKGAISTNNLTYLVKEALRTQQAERTK